MGLALDDTKLTGFKKKSRADSDLFMPFEIQSSLPNVEIGS